MAKKRDTTGILINGNEELFRKIIENSPLGIALVTPNFRFFSVNPAWAAMTGYTEEELLKMSFRDITHPDHLAGDLRHIQELIAGIIPVYQTEKRYIRKDGSILWGRLMVTTLLDSAGSLVYLVAQIEDITEPKRIEQQREALIGELEKKNAELEHFTYTVSHDLKGPLITIRGFAGLIEKDARNGYWQNMEHNLHRINTAAEKMQELLSDILELSRVGKVINLPEKTSFEAIAREAADLLAGPLAERGVAVEIAPNLPEVTVDRSRIREVLVNLIENAIKSFGSRTDPVIQIGADQDGKVPVFFVRDNGIGIDPQYLERIFNLFEKLDASVHGTGIGLPIVRRIIEVHGGKVWAESEGMDKKATFRFTLQGTDEPGKKSS